MGPRVTPAGNVSGRSNAQVKRCVETRKSRCSPRVAGVSRESLTFSMCLCTHDVTNIPTCDVFSGKKQAEGSEDTCNPAGLERTINIQIQSILLLNKLKVNPSQFQSNHQPIHQQTKWPPAKEEQRT